MRYEILRSSEVQDLWGQCEKERANWASGFRKSTEFTSDHGYWHKASTTFKFAITMSGTDLHQLAASLRQLGGRQNSSESHLPDISSSPEQLEGEHRVRFASFTVHLYWFLVFQHSQTPLPQPKHRMKDKFKGLFTSKSKNTSQTNSSAHLEEDIHPTEVCTNRAFKVSLITNSTGLTSLRTRSLLSLWSLLRIKSCWMPPTQSMPQFLQPWMQLMKMRVQWLLLILSLPSSRHCLCLILS